MSTIYTQVWKPLTRTWAWEMVDLQREAAAAGVAGAGSSCGGGGGGGGGGVRSFNGRKGIVVPKAGDYSADLISYTSGLGTDVEAALDGLLNVSAATTVTITNPGDEVAAPDLDVPFKIVYVDAAANGIVRLPLLSTVPYNYEYLFCRPPGSATATANMVAISAVTPPDSINGRAGNTSNAPVYLDVNNSNGTGVLIRAGETCWHAVGGVLASEGIDATDPILPWSGFNLIRGNSAAATFTLPLLSATMGSTMGRGGAGVGLIYASQACTIQCAGANVIIGSLNGVIYNSATSFPLAQGESAIVCPTGSASWFVH